MLRLEHKEPGSRGRSMAQPAQHRPTLQSATTVIQRAASCACGGSCPRCQAKSPLKIGAPDDAYEREADAVADRVMRMPRGEALVGSAGPTLQRKCTACEEEDEEQLLQPKRESSGAAAHGNAAIVPSTVNEVLSSQGQPLAADTRAFFEPRFGQSFADVRVHTGAVAAESAQAIGARAYTVGRDVVFAGKEYGGGDSSRRLLAHELAHVMQQGAGAPQATVRRQIIGAGCATSQSVLQEAWAEGRRLASETITTLDNTLQSIGLGVAPSPIVATALRNAFGDVGLEPGGFTFLPELIRRYRLILGGFTDGKTLRCDPESIASAQNECDWRSAFVIVGDTANIFLCPAFLASTASTTSRGLTLLHEMAHSVLRIGHTGLAERTFPAAFFDCQIPLDLEWDDAKRNAFAFDRLADCLHGERPSSEVQVSPTTPGPAPAGSRWSISAGAGADVTPDAYRFASALSGRVSLRTGEFVVFNPVIGLNLLYLPPSDFNPSHLVAATADLGLRIQQPLEGFYFDVAAGGYAGFDIDPSRGGPAEFTGGPTGAVGLGWRFRHLEIGPEARALVPEGDFDRTQVLVFGRAAWRFE